MHLSRMQPVEVLPAKSKLLDGYYRFPLYRERKLVIFCYLSKQKMPLMFVHHLRADRPFKKMLLSLRLLF